MAKKSATPMTPVKRVGATKSNMSGMHKAAVAKGKKNSMAGC